MAGKKKDEMFSMTSDYLEMFGVTDDGEKIAVMVGVFTGYLMRLRGFKQGKYWNSFWSKLDEPFTLSKLHEVFEKTVSELHKRGYVSDGITSVQQRIASLDMHDSPHELKFYFTFGLAVGEEVTGEESTKGELSSMITGSFETLGITDSGRQAAMVTGALAGRLMKFKGGKGSAYWNAFWNDIGNGVMVTLPDLRDVFVGVVSELHEYGYLDNEIISLQYTAALLNLYNSASEDLGFYFLVGFIFGRETQQFRGLQWP
ncbi:MAG: hypothetical protein QXU18_07470 [Thermoplasmatales archaeon]